MLILPQNTKFSFVNSNLYPKSELRQTRTIPASHRQFDSQAHEEADLVTLPR